MRARSDASLYTRFTSFGKRGAAGRSMPGASGRAYRFLVAAFPFFAADHRFF
jgi:hypothetical protein